MSKVRVPIYKTPGKSVTIETDPATASGLTAAVKALQQAVAELRARIVGSRGSGGGSGTALASTDDLREGAYNLYFTAKRAVVAIANVLKPSANVKLTYSAADGLQADLLPTGVSDGTYGDSTHVAQVTVDAKGRATAVEAVAIALAPPELVPTYIADEYTVPANRQALWTLPITLADQAVLRIDGALVEVN